MIYFPVGHPAILLLKDLSLEKLAMSEAGGGIGFGQGLQNWQLVLSGKQFNSGHPDSTCLSIWNFWGQKMHYNT